MSFQDPKPFCSTTEIWDDISRRIDREIELCREISSFLRRRRTIEDDYMKKLVKLFHQFRQSPVGARAKLLLALTQNEVKVRDVFGPFLVDKICDPTELSLREIERQQRQTVLVATNVEQELNDSVLLLRKAKTAYAKMERKAGKNPEGKAKAEAEYKRQLEVTNNFMANCYTERFPQFFKELQQLESSALMLEKDQLKKLASAFESQNTNIGLGLTNLIKQLEFAQTREQQSFTDVIQIPKKYSYDSLEDLEESFLNAAPVASELKNFVKENWKISSMSIKRKFLSASKQYSPEIPTEIEAKKWELEDVLLHDYGVQSFKKFLESEFNAEYMLFLEAVDALYEIPDRVFLQGNHLEKIYTMFISDSAEYPINLPVHIRAPLVQAFEGETKDKSTIRKDIFDAAKDNIFMLIKNDSFRRYLKSSFYTDFITQLEKAQKEEFMSSMPVSSTTHLIFEVPLDDLMDRQQAKFPTKLVPHFVETIVQQIESLNGLETEGIFRISTKLEDLKAYKKQLNAGNFDLSTITDVHILAGLLKMWLKDLPVPLIPQRLYDSTIMLAWDPVASVEQVARLPANHQNLLKFLVKFLRRITPDKTLMDTSNLAMAFCGCIFGSRPQSDLSTELNNRTKEKQFIVNLLTHLSCEDVIKPSITEHNVDLESSLDLEIDSLSESETVSEPSTPPTPRNFLNGAKPRLKTLEQVRASEMGGMKDYKRLSAASLNEQLKIESISNELLDVSTKLKASEMERDRILKDMEHGQHYLLQTRSHLQHLFQSLDEQAPQESTASRIANRFSLTKRRISGQLAKKKEKELSGEIHLKIRYTRPHNDTSEGTLILSVIEARNLMPSSGLDSCNPYVRITVGRQKKKTKIMKKTSTPMFNELFEFKVPANNQIVVISVKDVHKVLEITRNIKDWSSTDRIGRPTLLGSVTINLQELEGSTGNAQIVMTDRWFSLKGDTEDESDPEIVNVPLSASPPSSNSTSLNSSFDSITSSGSTGSVPSSPLNASLTTHLNLKQELEILEERLEYETEKMAKKITRLKELNAEISQLNASKTDLRDELQQVEQVMFMKALNKKSLQLEQEKKAAKSQKAASDEHSKELQQLKTMLEEKTLLAEKLQNELSDQIKLHRRKTVTANDSIVEDAAQAPSPKVEVSSGTRFATAAPINANVLVIVEGLIIFLLLVLLIKLL